MLIVIQLRLQKGQELSSNYGLKSIVGFAGSKV